MSAPRRLVPPLSYLQALESVARLGTVSAAAEELALTQGAVSRALQGLEAQLGAALFMREKQRLRLTPAGQDYAGRIRAALAMITDASLKLRANPEGGSLNLAILPAFGVHWLAPRLADFARAASGVTVNLSTRLRPFDIAGEGFDAAIHFGRPDWQGAEHLLLMEEEVLPVCAPSLLPQPMTAPEELLTLPLLQLESRTGAWGRYLAAQGVAGQRPQGMLFDQFATMQQGAIHGLGVALLPLFLIDDDLRAGRLVAAWPARGVGLGSYYLVWPRDAAPRPALIAFRDWIAVQVASVQNRASQV